MYDPAECGDIADALPDRVSDGQGDSVADELTDPVAFADLASVVRSAQRTLGHGRMGTGCGNASLPFVRSWRHVGGTVDTARSRQHRGFVR